MAPKESESWFHTRPRKWPTLYNPVKSIRTSTLGEHCEYHRFYFLLPFIELAIWTSGLPVGIWNLAEHLFPEGVGKKRTRNVHN